MTKKTHIIIIVIMAWTCELCLNSYYSGTLLRGVAFVKPATCSRSSTGYSGKIEHIHVYSYILFYMLQRGALQPMDHRRFGYM